MNKKDQKKLAKAMEALISFPDVKGKRKTPTQKELQEKYQLKVKDKTFKMEILGD